MEQGAVGDEPEPDPRLARRLDDPPDGPPRQRLPTPGEDHREHTGFGQFMGEPDGTALPDPSVLWDPAADASGADRIAHGGGIETDHEG
ncbi:hypothetical protein ABZX85_37105 [Streptomyces sp. NPDC004539]|uniref:hypothetical protein n=1 Tax=Streptomyces sp. NPDC004539 TaxID=3154280 RepID=UPI0033BC09A6